MRQVLDPKRQVAAFDLADLHVQPRGMFLEVPRPDAEDPLLVVGNPVKMSRVSEGPVAPLPRLGEHTQPLLRETLGLSESELASLARAGVIAAD